MSNSFENGYALLIAVDKCAVPGKDLPDVLKDVKALEAVLIHPQRCGYKAANVKVISGKDSTRKGIVDGLDWLQKKLKADKSGNATAVVYYTGHGHVQDKRYYLIPCDATLERLNTRAIRAEDFAADITALKPKRLLVMLDCCHAAGIRAKSLAAKGASVNSVAIPPSLFTQGEKTLGLKSGAKSFDKLAQGAGRAVISSSQASELSWIRKDGAMSVFTYHVIEAFTGHAQPQDGAAEALVSDLMGHVSRRVPVTVKTERSEAQNPDFIISGNFPVSLVLGGKGLGAGDTAPDPVAPLPKARKKETVKVSRSPGSTNVAGDGNIVAKKRAVVVTVGNTGNINTGTQIDTGGGAFIRGNVKVGGDFVGRDKIVRSGRRRRDDD